jgi:UDP-glucose 4-epimerase
VRVLVTGGAGYVGSHTVCELLRCGHRPVVLDNLSEGHPQAIGDCPLIRADLADDAAVRAALEQARPDAVMHFAARAYVGESVAHPEAYYYNNVVCTLNLLRAMRAGQVGRIVFSSSCTVYGVPDSVPITEDFPVRPLSPYGRTKAAVEGILADYAAAYGLRCASLRYFNAAGADAEGRLGEDHSAETHLIPLVIFAALGQRPNVSVFGTDYPTPDGTCVRDYVHVADLAAAHVAALERLDERPAMVYNLSTGQGHSVREVIEEVRLVSGRDFEVVEAARRPGDAPALVGSALKAERELGWQPCHSSIREIVGSAWRWHSTHPGGYGPA